MKLTEAYPSEQYRIAAKDWVAKEAEAHLLEQCKSSVLAQLMIKQGDVPVSHAEREVKASAEWREYVEKMCAARQDANAARVRMKWTEMRSMEWQSSNANRRAEMRL